MYIYSPLMRQHDYEDGVQDRHAAEDAPKRMYKWRQVFKCSQTTLVSRHVRACMET